MSNGKKYNTLTAKPTPRGGYSPATKTEARNPANYTGHHFRCRWDRKGRETKGDGSELVVEWHNGNLIVFDEIAMEQQSFNFGYIHDAESCPKCGGER